MQYRRRAQPSVTMAQMAAGQPLSEAAPPGCPAHVGTASIEKASVDPHGTPPVGCPAHAPGTASSGNVAAEPVVGRGTTKLRIRIDRDLCQGHGVCAGECPEVFAVGRDQKVMLKVVRPPAELHEKVRLAAKHCPTRTIRLEEESDAAEA